MEDVLPLGTPHPHVAPNSEEWMALRQTCAVNASSAGALCGLGIIGAYGAVETARFKRLPRYRNAEPFRGNEATAQGHYYEPVIRHVHEAYLRAAMGRPDLRVIEDCIWTGRVPGFAGLWGATPDGRVELGTSTLNCEYKAPFYRMYSEMTCGRRAPAFKRRWASSLGHGVKMEHCVQMHVQMALTGRRTTDYVAIKIDERKYTAARVAFSEPFYRWMLARMREADAWLELPLVELERVDIHEAARKWVEPPVNAVAITPLDEIYPHVKFADFIPPRSECEAIAAKNT